MTTLVSCFDFGHDFDRYPRFTGSEIVHIYDVFETSFLQNIFKRKGLPAAVLSDTVLLFDNHADLGVDFFGFPFWLAKQCRKWSSDEFDDNQELQCDFVFNFMVNKKQCSRFLLMKLVEIGGYDSFQYTWSGIGRSFDMKYIIRELDGLPLGNALKSDKFRELILSPIGMSERFISDTGTAVSTNTPEIDGYAYRGYVNNKHSWDYFLNDLFTRSCVSLISETGNYDRLCVHSEKTVYAFFGLTFPIWVGNFAQASVCEKMGFDVFNDVIDHGYQWYPTLIERCYWAFELNKRLLNDLSYARKQRQLHRDRLLANRKRLLQGELERHCDRLISALPSRYQPAANLVRARFMKD